MRLLIVGLGGVTASFRNWPERTIALAMAQRGHEVRAIGTRDPTRPALASRRERIEGIDVRRVRPGYWPNRELASALAAGPPPDLIHLLHPRNTLAAQTTAWALRHGIPTVYTWNGPYHDPYLVADRERPFAAPPRYERLIFTRSALLGRLLGARGYRQARDLLRNYRLHWPLRAAARLLPCSQHEAEEMRRMGLTQPITMVPQWIDLAGIDSEPIVSPPLGAPRPWLLFVGQLTPRKGYDIALRALPRILARHPNASLLIVSGINPADRAAVDRLAGEQGVAAHVHYLGRVDDTTVVNLFRSCDAYLSPTRYEGFGLTLLEAMAAGAPVVGTDVAAVHEIVRDGENGLLAPPEDPEAFAAATLRLLGDDALRERVRSGGRAAVTGRFNPAALADRLESAYRAALQAPKLGETEYFAGQVSKSDRKIAVHYRRLFALAGLSDALPEGPVLDVGCGAGPGLRYLAGRGRKLVGVDGSFYALRQAASLVRCEGLAQVDLRGALPFRDGAFGLVVATEVIEHLPEGLPFLRECLRVLRPGGVLLLTTPNLWDVRRFTSPLLGRVWSGVADPTHVNLYTPRRLGRELSRAGFRSRRLRTGLKPMLWLPPYSDPFAIPYPPWIGNGIVARSVREP